MAGAPQEHSSAMQRNRPEKIRQHTVARRYLKGFTVDEDQLIQYDREMSTCYPVSVDDASVVKRIYSIQQPNGEWDDSIEDYFMQLEGDAGPILENLIAGQTPTKSEKCVFALYLARQMQRGQFMADFARREALRFRDPRFLVTFLEKHHQQLAAQCGEQELDKAIREFAAHPQGVDIDPKTYLRVLIPETPPYAAMIADLHWRVERSRKSFFVTSDQPTCVRRRGQPVNPRVVGLLVEDAELYFPLNKNRLLIASKTRPRDWKTDVGVPRVREINRIIVIHAFRFVFAPAEDRVLELLIDEHKQDRVRFPEIPW